MRLNEIPTYWSIRPKAVLAGKKTGMTIAPYGGDRYFRDEKYTVEIKPMEHNIMRIYNETESYDRIDIQPSPDGKLRFDYAFSGEQMYSIVIFRYENGAPVKLTRLFVFSLFEDLYRLRPYKGDTHVHSEYSDGRESPAIVAANYRGAGFDFMAVTDHRQHAPSKEAIETYKNVPTGISLFEGEEVHVPTGYIHAINFGGKISVNDLYNADPEKADAEIRAIAASINDPDCPSPIDFAARKWIADKVRQGGGISIFVHPHWITGDVFNVADVYTEYTFRSGVYDAFELLNGQSIFENNMQTAFYAEMREKGVHIPVVGASDSHGTEHNPAWFNMLYTVVFADGCGIDAIRDAIRSFRSVGVEKYSDDTPRAYGNYRYVKYALFLLREYFPLYTKLCAEQGESMKLYAHGSPEESAAAKKVLEALDGRTDRFYEEFFGR